MISNYLYALIAATLLSVGFAGGFVLEHKLSTASIATLKADQEKALAVAENAKDQADLHAADVERTASNNQAKLISDYERRLSDAKTTSDSTINNLRAGISRLRVTVANSSGGKMPDITADLTGSHGESTATLDATVAARLATRYADYNKVVAQLSLCQAVVANDRAIQAASSSP